MTDPQTSESTIHLSAPDVGDAERAALVGAFDSGWIAPVGPDLDAFEAELAAYSGAPGAVGLSSGTAALHLALLLAGVGRDDEVVVQSATFAASAFAVHHAGAVPVFCDSERGSWCLDPQLLDDFLDARAAEGRLPKAVMPVDLYGSTANYPAIIAVCENFGVAVVRDAAEALGSLGLSGAVGSEACLTALSFNGNKIITTSSGGALLGPSDALERARFLSTQAREPFIHYEHNEIGYNYRLSNILAALGRAQLGQLEARIERRTQIAAMYKQALPELAWCSYAHTPRPNNWLAVGLMGHGDPIAVCATMQASGVQARPAWKPMHLQPVFADREYVRGDGVADELFSRGICFPSGSSMTDGDVHRVIDEFRRATPRTATAGS